MPSEVDYVRAVFPDPPPATPEDRAAVMASVLAELDCHKIETKPPRRRRQRRPWIRGLTVVVVAAAIAAAFFAPLPHLSLFHRLVSPTKPGTTVPRQLPLGTLAVLEGSDTVAGDEFGFSVAISGTTAVVGAPDAQHGAGRAYVFARVATGWAQVAELQGSDTSAGGYFGASVAVSGRTIVVGAPGHGVGLPPFGNVHAAASGPGKSGSAYVFTDTPTGWRQVERLEGSGAATEAGAFGYSVAISGATAVVWAEPASSSAGVGPLAASSENYGWVYIFASAGGVWQQVAKLKQTLSPLCFSCVPESPSPYRVSISGTTVLATTRYSASVITKTATGWKQTAELKSSNPDLDISSVSVSGMTALAGGVGIGAGGWAFVFSKTPSGWKQIREWDRGGVYFGGSAAISGETIVVGEIGNGAHQPHGYGQVYVFAETAAGWKQATVLNGTTEGFGWSLAISGSTAIVGAGLANDSDRVYLFHV
jgi:hypothetical protein